LDIAKRIGDAAAQFTCYTNFGLVYHSLGDHQKALDYYNKALDIAKRIDNVAGETVCYGNISSIYLELYIQQQKVDYKKPVQVDLNYLETPYQYLKKSIELDVELI
jgi:tetratricopeptide (TPR) repeat protein